MTDVLRAGGALAALVVAVGIAAGVIGRGAKLLEIQLGTNVGTVRTLIEDPAQRRAVRRAIAADYFFIAAYLATFVTLGVAIVRRDGGWTIVGAAAIAAAVATAALDVLENRRTLGILAPGESADALSQQTLDALRHVSLAKWGACAVTVGLLAGVVLVHGWPVTVAVVLLAIAVLGLCGLKWHRLIPPFFMGVFAATVAIAVILLAFPASIADRY